MIPFQTTPDQLIELASHVTAMKKAGLDAAFIAEAFDLARVDQGVFDLMALWSEVDSKKERDEIVADIRDVLDDYLEAPRSPEHKPYIPFDELNGVASSIQDHKKRLRALIDRNGGVSEVARRSGIPQPSLSRMLKSGSMPRRTTLYRIANALGLSESDVFGDWIR
jgi:transcriptional regulator with XRE-family HTH domain